MKALVFILFSVTCFVGTAQKLPNVQQVTLRAPANVKIDGKGEEWGEYKAYNKATDIFYNIANDGDNLYIVVQARDILPIQKIISGGLTVTFSPADKKDTNAVSLTYPINNNSETPAYLAVMNKPKPDNDTAAYHRQTDNFKNAGNKLLTASGKFIGISGFKTISDNKIPIYNTEGISVAAMLNPSLYYTFELAVPLKLLKDQITSSNFRYNIRVNGITNNNTNLKAISRTTFYILTFTGSDGKNYMLDSASPDQITPTDFWGEYTLAKF